MKSTVPSAPARRSSASSPSRARRASATSRAPSSSRRARRSRTSCNPDRVVVGDDGDWAGDAVVELYAPLDAPLVRTDIASAEMVKLASNAFLATKISFINEIANVCEETGADVIEVAAGMGLDDRIGPKFLQAGIGFGGSCFPKDVTRAQAARRQLGLPLPAAQRGHRGQRAAEAARHRQAPEAPRLARRQARSRCSASPSSRTPTTCARRRSLVLAARLQADGAEVVASTTRSPRRRRGELITRRRASPPTRSTRSRRRRRRARHRVARVQRARLVATSPSRMRGHARHRRAQRPRRRRRRAPPGSSTRASDAAPPASPASTGAPSMQAVILVGGEGTRLRPLTSTVPKPVVPLVDRPFIAYMLEWLRRHGVDDVILSCGFLADEVRNVLGDGSRLRRAAALRRGARAARHRRRAEVRRGAPRRALPDAQRRRADRHRPHARRSPSTRRPARGHARARPGRGPDAPTAWCASTTTRASRASSRSRPPTRSTRTSSPPAPTCSSAACST